MSTTQVASLIKGVEEHNTFLHNAQEQLILRCMRRQGFDYHPSSATGFVPDPFRGSRLDPATVARQGYGLRRAKTGGRPQYAQDAYVASLSADVADRYGRALNGTEDSAITATAAGLSVSTNSNGCAAEAEKVIWGDLSAWLRLTFTAANVLGEASRDVESDSALIDARAVWSKCMKDAGFDYRSRTKARDDLVKRYETPGVDQAEVFASELATAQADVACSRSTGFEKVQADAQDRAANMAVTKYEPELLALRQLNSESVARARQALASS